MHNHMEDKIKHGRGTQVYATHDTGGVRRLVLVGDFDTVRYHFNQMAALVGGHAMALVLDLASAPGAGAGFPTGAWTDRVSGRRIVLPSECFELAANGPSDDADLIGAMARFKDWPDGLEALPSTKHLCTSMGEVGDLFYATRDTLLVRAGRAQERSTVKRVEEALKEAKSKGYSVMNEEGLRTFMKHYAEAKYLQAIHSVEAD